MTVAPEKGSIRKGNEQKILKAAEKVFAEAGFAGATMADIAAEAKLPKANLHYYFGTKEDLYRAVLSNILDLWLSPVQGITPDADPATAVAEYVRTKLDLSYARPNASRVFANEVLHGAPLLDEFLKTDLRAVVEEKAAVIEGWIERGLIAPVDPRHFLFMVWALTQHYADFDVQIRAVLGKRKLTRADFDHVAQEVTAFVLRGLGVRPQEAEG